MTRNSASALFSLSTLFRGREGSDPCLAHSGRVSFYAIGCAYMKATTLDYFGERRVAATRGASMRAWAAGAALVICGATDGHCDQVSGAGSTNCLEFGRTLARLHGANVENFYFSWALGFMSATNQYATSPRDLAAIPAAAAMAAIKAYCKAHPTADYVDAVTDLVSTLPSKAAR